MEPTISLRFAYIHGSVFGRERLSWLYLGSQGHWLPRNHRAPWLTVPPKLQTSGKGAWVREQIVMCVGRGISSPDQFPCLINLIRRASCRKLQIQTTSNIAGAVGGLCRFECLPSSASCTLIFLWITAVLDCWLTSSNCSSPSSTVRKQVSP